MRNRRDLGKLNQGRGKIAVDSKKGEVGNVDKRREERKNPSKEEVKPQNQ